MIRYKLTTQDMKTRKGSVNETTWKVGEWVEASGNLTGELCSDAYIHWYAHPLLAVMLNPIHAAIDNPRMWECETDGDELSDLGLKGGSRKMRLLKEITAPSITPEQCVRFAILCMKWVHDNEMWNIWADNWLSGKDRSRRSAAAARDVAYAAADIAAAHAAAAARDVAYAAADIAAYAARAARLAAVASDAAVRAAADATAAGFDLIAIAEAAVKETT